MVYILPLVFIRISTDAVLSRLRDAEVTTFRTDMQGDIACVSDGNKVAFVAGRNAEADISASVGPTCTQRSGQRYLVCAILGLGMGMVTARSPDSSFILKDLFISVTIVTA